MTILSNGYPYPLSFYTRLLGLMKHYSIMLHPPGGDFSQILTSPPLFARAFKP